MKDLWLTYRSVDSLFSIEGFNCKWGKHIWLGENRVWFRRCKKCGQLEFWRGNDTILVKGDIVNIIEQHYHFDKQFVRSCLKEMEETEFLLR